MKPDFRQPTILYGGSFDPVHEGHLHVAREARKAFPFIKQFLFVPAAMSPGKREPLASPAQRLAWLHMVAAPEGNGVWDFELSRGGESYTVDTLEECHRLGGARDKLYLLLGADAYAGMPRWKTPDRVRELCRLVVVDRPGQETPAQHAADLFLSIPTHPASSSEIRAQLASGSLHPRGIPVPVLEDLQKICPPFGPYVRK